VPGRQIHPDRAGDHDRIMSRSPQRLDGLATDQSGSTSHCDSHDRTFIPISQALM
jgi:hypothetical protein